MKNKKKEIIPFIKFHPGLSCLFSPAETVFILHMVNLEYFKAAGYRVSWSNAGYIRRMGLKECAFKRCVERFSQMKLLTRTYNSLGNRVFYSINMELYNRLVEIVSSTYDCERLAAFCDTKFRKEARPIESITAEEIRELEG
jgi:hypothetical protein